MKRKFFMYLWKNSREKSLGEEYTKIDYKGSRYLVNKNYHCNLIDKKFLNLYLRSKNILRG